MVADLAPSLLNIASKERDIVKHCFKTINEKLVWTKFLSLFFK